MITIITITDYNITIFEAKTDEIETDYEKI